MTIEIKTGSEKQIEWANQIAAKWLAAIDSEIATAASRPEADGIGWYVEALRAGRERMIAVVSAMTARQVIDYQQSPNHGPVTRVIEVARTANH